jgi:hypothetical protein
MVWWSVQNKQSMVLKEKLFRALSFVCLSQTTTKCLSSAKLHVKLELTFMFIVKNQIFYFVCYII